MYRFGVHTLDLATTTNLAQPIWRVRLSVRRLMAFLRAHRNVSKNLGIILFHSRYLSTGGRRADVDQEHLRLRQLLCLRDSAALLNLLTQSTLEQMEVIMF